ncbi:hypothetical protein HX001_13180 [Empedobacter brevis]|uniref:Outer membrane protein beta-barrel domain-containing protein n=2 Tax=Empedobacter brevis TaxID=247 RepID=A0A511NEY8_9FLAO|nr:hypothetical protein [Empedobacter brevis]MDM1073437.1 hypothetical protein [Empedobacter brevis]GEM51156.1 hypothetical protein EB1_09460 [Empedobacter brevis NBRC 14943 = ATCC 43319]
MKKILLTFLVSTSLFAQEKTTNLFNVNASVIGIGVQFEKSLGEKYTGVASLDYIGGFMYSYSDYSGSDFDYVLTTRFALEGRYYYNFDRRIEKGKNTTNNSANYIAFKTVLIPDWFTTSSDNLKINPQGALTLNYGLKRSFSKKFFYEFYTGLGISLYEEDRIYYDENAMDYRIKNSSKSGIALDLGFRVGYNF